MTRFPALALVRFGFAGANGNPNFSRLPIMGECSASTSQSQRIHSVALLPAGARVLEGFFMASQMVSTETVMAAPHAKH
jgi:hypothetical protein